MTIEEKVRAVCADALPDFAYIFADWFDASRIVSKSPLPAVVNILPVSGTMEVRNGRRHDVENGAVAFVDKVPKDATGEDNAKVYNRMKDAAFVFLRAINNSGYFEPVGEAVGFSVIYEQLTSIVTGVMLDIQLRELPQC